MDGNVIHMCVKNHVFFVIAIILIIYIQQIESLVKYRMTIEGWLLKSLFPNFHL